MKPARKRQLLRIAIILAFPASLLLAYLLWTPGVDLRDGRHDRNTNAIWMQHGWLGDDRWFTANQREAKKNSFRDPAQIAQLAAALNAHRMRYVFPHLCPAEPGGDIAPSDPAQVDRFLDAMGAVNIETLPWVGGVRGSNALPDDANWRQRFVASCVQLLARHPRLAGIHVNIEPMPSGDPDFLKLLDELRVALPAGKILSVAAYPPPTYWQQSPEVHWDEAYSRAVSSRVDQAAVMMYDTSLRSAKLYQKLMRDWTVEILEWYKPKQVLLGLPAYDDAGVGYHDPAVENLEHALAGIHAGLANPLPAHYAGVAIYCEWEMTPEKWQTYHERFAAN